MFKPAHGDIKKFAKLYPQTIRELEGIFDKPTNVYIDYANVVRWQSRLGWHHDFRRLKKLFDSFDTVRHVKFYNGTIEGDKRSESLMKLVNEIGKVLFGFHFCGN